MDAQDDSKHRSGNKDIEDCRDSVGVYVLESGRSVGPPGVFSSGTIRGTVAFPMEQGQIAAVDIETAVCEFVTIALYKETMCAATEASEGRRFDSADKTSVSAIGMPTGVESGVCLIATALEPDRT